MTTKRAFGIGALLMSTMGLLVGCGWENTDTFVDGLNPPEPPEAVIDVDADSGTAPLGVKFDGSSSSAPEGATIEDYEWTFGDDSSEAGANVAHTYTSPGDYTAELTVTTNEGATDTDSVQISVRPNERPDPTFSHSPQSPRTNETVTFDASGSTDAAGLSAQEIVSYRWNFGDGDTANGEIVEHRYDDDGDYDVMLTLVDDGDETASMTKTISVRNRSPEASIDADPTSGTAPLSVSFDAPGSSDSDGLIQSYDWGFGDGDTGSGKTTRHSYANEGTYIVTLTVTDDDGAEGTATIEVSASAETSQSDSGGVIIDALLPNPVAEEPDEEWILVCNDSSATADISGWTLLDDNGRYSFPEGTTLESQECRTVYGSTYNPTGNTQELFLANAGETVRLRDSSGNEMDRCSYDDATEEEIIVCDR